MTQPAAASGPDATFPSPGAERLNGLGRFYSVMGPQNVYPHLFVMDWQKLQPQPLVPDAFVTNVAACEDLVVVANVVPTKTDDGKTKVEHRLLRLAGSRLEPIEGVGRSAGSAMAVDAACRITYVLPPDEDGRYVVRSFDPRSSRARELFVSDEQVGRIAWLGDVLLARVGKTAEDWRIIAIEDGEARDLDVQIEPGEAFHVHPSGWMAIADPAGPGMRLHHLVNGRELACCPLRFDLHTIHRRSAKPSRDPPPTSASIGWGRPKAAP